MKRIDEEDCTSKKFDSYKDNVNDVILDLKTSMAKQEVKMDYVADKIDSIEIKVDDLNESKIKAEEEIKFLHKAIIAIGVISAASNLFSKKLEVIASIFDFLK